MRGSNPNKLYMPRIHDLNKLANEIHRVSGIKPMTVEHGSSSYIRFQGKMYPISNVSNLEKTASSTSVLFSILDRLADEPHLISYPSENTRYPIRALMGYSYPDDVGGARIFIYRDTRTIWITNVENVNYFAVSRPPYKIEKSEFMGMSLLAMEAYNIMLPDVAYAMRSAKLLPLMSYITAGEVTVARKNLVKGIRAYGVEDIANPQHLR